MIGESGLVISWWIVALIGGFVLGVLAMFVLGIIAGRKKKPTLTKVAEGTYTGDGASERTIDFVTVQRNGEQDG